MGSLKNLKARIKSIKSTRKITKAMQLIAAARLRNVRNKSNSANEYLNGMKEIFSSMIPHGIYDFIDNSHLNKNVHINNNINSLLQTNADLELCKKSNLIILFTADRGLCGQFNGSLIRAAKKQIFDTKNKNEISLLCIGKKGYEGLKNDGIRFMHNDFISFPPIKEMNFQKVHNDLLEVVHAINLHKSCTIIHSKFISMIKQEIVIEHSLFPKSNDANHNIKKDSHEYIVSLDGEKKLIIDLIINQYETAKLYSIMLDSMLSEYGARIFAMDGATRNSTKIIDRLSRQYNRSRQGQITGELIEIISGMEAI